jgi:hypothetical protein
MASPIVRLRFRSSPANRSRYNVRGDRLDAVVKAGK